MKIAFLCPGQGSQVVGMGADLVAAFPTARALYERADELLGWSASEVSFNGPAEQLNDTRYAQPALYVQSVAAGRVLLERGVKADFLAGHSLGEYSALALAGALSFEDGLRLVSVRGAAMAEAGRDRKRVGVSGTMAAIIGLDEKTVVDALSGIEGAVPANFNAPDQIVISGTIAGVAAASEKLAALGAKRVVPLKVSGAFHSPLVASAAAKLREVLDLTEIRSPRAPVVANVTGKPTSDPDEIRELLVRQIASPVRWTDSVRALARAGVTRCYEVGPGRVLQGLVRRVERSLEVLGAGTADEVRAAGV